MNALFRFFRSVKLAVVLIILIIVLSAFSTLVPQGKDEAFYRANESPFVADLVLATGMNDFKGSLLFLVPLGFFIVNLGVCTLDRLVSRARRGAARRYGPDILHIGLLVLCAGALVTTATRQEQYFTMAAGDEVELPGGYRLGLKNFDFQQYPDGRPKAWISTVDLSVGGKVLREGFPIEVNRPLGVGALKVYQSNYGRGIMRLTGPDGNTFTYTSGQGFSQPSSELYFADVDTGSGAASPVALVEEWKGNAKVGTIRVRVGDDFGLYKVRSVSAEWYTGLTAVKDPGFLPVLAALILIAAGMTLTVAQKKGEAI